MPPKRVFLVLDPEGNIVHTSKNPRGAVDAAESMFGSNVEIDIDPNARDGLGDLGALTPAAQMPARALQYSSLRHVDFEEARAMSLEEAHNRLKKYFPTHRRKAGALVRVRAYETPEKMAERILGQNYKTAKSTDEEPTDVQGLSLLPFDLADSEKAKAYIAGQGRQRLQLAKGKGLCAGSSPMCKAACLVFSGRNEADPYNSLIKLARTEALLRDTTAMVRMILEACEKHAKIRNAEPYVRLNVFSDIPWELVVPGLFEYFMQGDRSRLTFYDYTKVPGRRTPENYDLTFSYSGVNADYMKHEVQRGRRVAVVFLHPPGMKWLKAKDRPEGYGLPRRFAGLEVKDGDVTDVRPRDPAPCIVALRWKSPKNAGESREERAGRAEKAKGFTRQTMHGTGMAARVIFAQEVDGWFVTAQSASMEPIDDADADAWSDAAE